MMKTGETNIIRNPLLRVLLQGAGWLSVVLAFLGAFLPLLPTTPFLTLAAFCFYKSSPRFYDWLMNNKLFGKYIRDYKEKKGIPLRVKIGTLIFLWVSILASVLFLVDALWAQLLLITIAAGVTIHIVLIRTNWQNGKM